MNAHREENSCCYFHPKEVVIGVCPLCLNERLLILAAKQGHLPSARGTRRSTQDATNRKPPINLPKIFALGSFLNRLEFRHSKSDKCDLDASTSQEGMLNLLLLLLLLLHVASVLCCCYLLFMIVGPILSHFFVALEIPPILWGTKH